MQRAAAAALVLTAAPLAAAADRVTEAALEIRRGGCGTHPGTQAELRRDARLDAVARRWSQQGGGSRLDVAFETERVRARQSASLSISRATGEQATQSMRARLCNELTDAEWTRLGWHARGDTLWVVVAVPSQAPQPAQLEAINQRALALVNAIRARGTRCGDRAYPAVPPLRLNATLTAAAQTHAEEMARYRFLAHEGRDGSTPGQRATRAGYMWRTVGENVAAGPESAEEVVRGFEQSPDHCHNLMDPDFTEMGLAFATNPQATGHSTWWSQVFGRPR